MKMPETQDLSDQLVHSFMTVKLRFAPSLVSNMKFANVHRLPRCTDANKISNSTSKRPPPIVVKWSSALWETRWRFWSWLLEHDSFTARLQNILMQKQRKSLLAHVNMLFKARKKIQWKVIDADYCLFADGEQEMPEVRSMPSRYNKTPDSNI